MNSRAARSMFLRPTMRTVVAILCIAMLVPGESWAFPQGEQQAEAATKVPSDQLDSLVAPIALYPDPLLAQVLVASTYPLEIIQLQQWLEKNKNLKDKALTEAVQKQDWDASIQALVVLPDVVKQLADNIKWTTDLGNAFLAQQSDVMDAVQRMRTKAKDGGKLKSTEQQKVETKVVENKTVVVIEPSKPDVIYVPSYDPVVVYGAPAYPYPPVAPPAGYYAAGMALSFGVGMMVGAAASGGWGWGCGWGGNNNININNSNNFVNNSNRQNVNAGNRTGNRTGNSNWQHNPQHRGGAPYSNKATANKFGGTARGDSMSSRQASARQNQSQRSSRPQNASLQGGGRQAGSMDRSAGGRTGSSGAGASNMGANRGAGGGDRVGNRSVSSGGGSRGSSAFGGGSGSSARASSARGSSSMRGGGGGGRRR